jgi:hypothetical protein
LRSIPNDRLAPPDSASVLARSRCPLRSPHYRVAAAPVNTVAPPAPAPAVPASPPRTGRRCPSSTRKALRVRGRTAPGRPPDATLGSGADDISFLRAFTISRLHDCTQALRPKGSAHRSSGTPSAVLRCASNAAARAPHVSQHSHFSHFSFLPLSTLVQPRATSRPSRTCGAAATQPPATRQQPGRARPGSLRKHTLPATRRGKQTPTRDRPSLPGTRAWGTTIALARERQFLEAQV